MKVTGVGVITCVVLAAEAGRRGRGSDSFGGGYRPEQERRNDPAADGLGIEAA